MSQPGDERILIVEDDELIAELLEEIVGSETPCRPLLARTAKDALALLAAARPRLVLLDLRLPDMDGLDLYDRLQADPGTANIPVLFLTANYGDPRFNARNLFDQVIAKPFQLDLLLNRLDALLRPAGGAMASHAWSETQSLATV